MLMLLQLSTARDFWGESLWHIASFDNLLGGTSVGCISHVDCCFLLFVLYFVDPHIITKINIKNKVQYYRCSCLCWRLCRRRRWRGHRHCHRSLWADWADRDPHFKQMNKLFGMSIGHSLCCNSIMFLPIWAWENEVHGSANKNGSPHDGHFVTLCLCHLRNWII